jgi:hypothetical protein
MEPFVFQIRLGNAFSAPFCFTTLLGLVSNRRGPVALFGKQLCSLTIRFLAGAHRGLLKRLVKKSHPKAHSTKRQFIGLVCFLAASAASFSS